jgi:hypothetical protein
MPPPIRRTYGAVRAYCNQLRALTDQLRDDPLDDTRSVALVAHIVTNRATAAHPFDIVERQRLGSGC